MIGKTICEQKVRLVNEYEAAVNAYSRTVNMLRRTRGILPKAEYDQVRNFSEKARIQCDAAHRALEQHTDEHGRHKS